MYRPFLIAFALSLSARLSASADEIVPPAAKLIVEKAAREVRKNKETFDRSTQKPLAEARKALEDLARKLIGDGKAEGATATLNLMKTLEVDVMKMADAPAPLGAVGRPAGQRALLPRLTGKWVRPDYEDDYAFMANGTIEARSRRTGQVTNMGQCRSVSEESGEVTWQSGHVWQFAVIGEEWMGVRESKDGKGATSGVWLQRSAK